MSEQNTVEWKSLGEIITQCDYGYTAKATRNPKGIVFLRISDITEDGTLKKEGFKYIQKNKEILNKYRLEENDIVIARSGSVGLSYLYNPDDGEMVFASYLIRFRVNPSIAKSEFVKYVLHSDLFYDFVNVKKRKVAQTNINATELKQFKLPLPSLNVQEKIVSILSRAENLKIMKTQANDLSDKLVESSFLELFKDCLVQGKTTLDEIAELNPKKQEIKDLPDNLQVSFIDMPSVSNKGEIINLKNKKLGEVKRGFTYFNNNDVLFAKITPCMENGKGAIAKNLKNSIGFGSTEFHILRPKKSVNSEWLFGLTQLKYFRQLAEKRMTGTAGQKRVPLNFLKNFKINIPEKTKQEQFKERLKVINSLRLKQSQSAIEVAELYSSLINKFVSEAI